MKIPVQHIDLGELGYENYWVEMPRSIKEGFLREFSKIGKRPAGAAEVEDADDSATRESNIKLLELVTAWNIDNDAGEVLPLISKCKTTKEKEAVLAELPVDVILHLAQRIAGNVNVPERTKDF